MRLPVSALGLVSTILFAFMIAIIKQLGETVPTGQLVFSRSFFALIPLFIMAIMQGSLRDCIQTQHPWLHVRRALVGVIAMSCWFSAVTMLPLPEATAISFLAPLLTVAFAAIFLKERVGIYRWSAVGVGFVGVMIILSPRLSMSGEDVGLLGAMLAAISTVFMAIAATLIRQMTKTEKNAAIIFYFFVAASGFSLFSLYWGWEMPDLTTMILLICAGLLGGIAQIFATQAFRLAEASLLAQFDYVNMIWAILIGVFLFSEYPTIQVLLGGAVVIAAGLFVVYRESRLGIARKEESKIRQL